MFSNVHLIWNSGKLIVCYDDNRITIDGDTALSFTEDVNKRYESYGWHVQTVEDVNDLEGLYTAMNNAKMELSKPSIIKIRTIIGQGSRNEGTSGVHGAPLGAADVAHVKKHYGFDPEQSFYVSPEVSQFYQSFKAKGEEIEATWNELFASYKAKFPDLAREYERRLRRELPEDWKNRLPSYTAPETKLLATRHRSEQVLNSIADIFTELVGGSADLTPSNLTNLKCSEDHQRDNPGGRYIRFGVREHAMAAICNGLFAYGFFRPYCASFLNFIGYALGSVRVSALSRFGIIYVMTHDSIGLGEDGPTHQPVEMLEYLRCTPNLLTIRPADANETAGAYEVALERVHTPAVLCLSRQVTVNVEGTSRDKVKLGAYVILDLPYVGKNRPDLIIVSTGTELQLAVHVAKVLAETCMIGVRVVSMPCCELFDEQVIEYQVEVFPVGSPVMSIEAAGTRSWSKYAHASFGIDTYGHSAPAPAVFDYFGFGVPNLVENAKNVLKFYNGMDAPSLTLRPKMFRPA